MPLQITVVTAERTVLSRSDATRVIVPTTEGQITLLPSHAPLMASVAIGELIIVSLDGQDAIAVHGGFLQIAKDTITILADAAEHADEIDEERTEAARQRAQRRLAGERILPDESAIDMLRARLAMERALTRLKVRRRRRGGVSGVPSMVERG
ncbi:MAG: ATP synthase F1 subunit epsilon [Dehalococcoidia bacterium]|nr:ATP synthase F1 subunit epsilon [Dehalococcoidia bacterium]